MQRFSLQTVKSAPEKSRPALMALEESFGFLPNVMATMANNPVLLNGFPDGSWDSSEMTGVTRALQRMLRQHQSFPAVVMDRYWNVLMANDDTPHASIHRQLGGCGEGVVRARASRIGRPCRG